MGPELQKYSHVFLRAELAKSTECPQPCHVTSLLLRLKY